MKLQITDLPIVDDVVRVDPVSYNTLTTEDKAFVDDTIHTAGIDDVTRVIFVEYMPANVETFVMSNGEERKVFKRDQLKPFTVTIGAF